MLQNADVIVIGAGALGLSVGYHLAQRGVRTLILERESSFAQHASGKNAGMIRQLYHHPQLTDWALRSLEGWPAEVRSCSFRLTGSLVVGRTVPGHHQSLFEQRVVETSLGPVNAVYTKTDGLLKPDQYMSALLDATSKNHLTLQLSTEVASVKQVGDLWEVITKNGGKYQARWLVNAAGAWLNRFLSGDVEEELVHAEPFARHLFLVSGWDRDYMPEHGVGFYWEEQQDWYVREWDDAYRLVSICDVQTADPDSFVPEANLREAVATKLRFALPEIAKNLKLGSGWHCFRTYTPDHLPIWGESSTRPRLFWLGAFGGFGMSTSFAAGLDAARYICGERVVVTDDFLPKRVQHVRNDRVTRVENQ